MAFVRHVCPRGQRAIAIPAGCTREGLPAPIGSPMSVDVAADGDCGAEHGEGGRPRDEAESAGRRASRRVCIPLDPK